MIKKSILMSVTSGVLMLLGLVSQHFLAKHLTQTQYGELQYMLSWIAILGFFSLSSFNTVVTKSAAQKYPAFFKTGSKFCFLSSILASLILLVVGFFFQTHLRALFIILAIFFPFYSGINLGQAFYIGSAQFKKYSIVAISTQALVSFSQIISVYLFPDVTIVLFIMLFTMSIINLIVTFYLAAKIKQKPNAQKSRSLTRYGFYLTLVHIIPALSDKIQYIILGVLTNPTTLAVYAVADIFPQKIRTFFKGFLNPFSIYLASCNRNRSVKVARKAIPFLFLIGLAVTGISLVFLPILIRIIFGDKYADSILYSLILLSVLIFVPVNAILSSVVVFHGYKKFYAKVLTFMNVFKIILYALLIPFFGVWGIITAIVLLSTVNFIVHLVWAFRLPKPKLKPAYLIINKSLESDNFENIIIKSKFTGKNIIRVIESDYLSKKDSYPFWVYVIAKISSTKFI